uniref:DUF2232 domain-containing protein n=1 Tax=Pararhizobium sp. IMCC3301 TaxID=3067904 RepID=UPI0027414B4E|nr:DUF2232 domain-containing protein [Pararhizobium sp. IMCC3301]
MTQIILISIGAGLLSALLFASVLTGSLLAIVLQIFAQLPIQSAALTFGPRAGLIAAVAAVAALLLVSGLPAQTVSYSLNFAAPALLASYLAGLRNTDLPVDQLAGWYPLGRLLSFVGGAAILIFLLLGLYSDFTPESAVLAIETQASVLLEGAVDTTEVPPQTITQIAVFFVALFPFVATAGLVAVTGLNLVLAIRIARRYGTFARPATSITTLVIPRAVHLTAMAAFLAIWLTGSTPPLLTSVAGASSALVILSGFAALHALTRRLASRGIILVAVYGSIILFTFPLLLILILGWIDGFLNLRGRFQSNTSNS